MLADLNMKPFQQIKLKLNNYTADTNIKVSKFTLNGFNGL